MNKREFFRKAAGATALAFAASQVRAAEAGTQEPAEGGIFDVMKFGAKGDGIQDDSPAIQKAIDAASTVSGTVFFPPARYACANILVKKNTTLKGDPKWAYGGENGAVLVLNNPEAGCVLSLTNAFGARISGLTITGKGCKTKRKIHGIYASKASVRRESAFTIEDCCITRMSGSGIKLRAWLFILRRNIFIFNGESGAEITGCDGFVSDNQFSGNALDGFNADGTPTVMFTANRVEWNGREGLALRGCGTWNVTGNSFDHNFGAGLYADGLWNASVSANIFRRNGRRETADNGNKIKSVHLYLKKCAGVTITANSSLTGRDDDGKGADTPEHCIEIAESKHTVISANTFTMGCIKEPVVNNDRSPVAVNANV